MTKLRWSLLALGALALMTLISILSFRDGIREGERRSRQFYAGKIVAFPENGEQIEKMMSGTYGFTMIFEPKTYFVKKSLDGSSNTFVNPYIESTKGAK